MCVHKPEWKIKGRVITFLTATSQSIVIVVQIKRIKKVQIITKTDHKISPL